MPVAHSSANVMRPPRSRSICWKQPVRHVAFRRRGTPPTHSSANTMHPPPSRSVCWKQPARHGDSGYSRRLLSFPRLQCVQCDRLRAGEAKASTIKCMDSAPLAFALSLFRQHNASSPSRSVCWKQPARHGPCTSCSLPQTCPPPAHSSGSAMCSVRPVAGLGKVRAIAVNCMGAVSGGAAL